MPDLAIIIPTRGRPENVRKVISAWDFTNAWDHADMVLVVDADDPEIGGYRAIEADTRSPDTGELIVTLIEVPAWLPMVHKLDAAARELAGRYFALGFAGDDHLPQTIGWAARYLTVLRELGTGMVYGDDGYQGVKLSTEWATTSDVVRALGRMVPAPVEHMYCDNAMMDLFGKAGALRHLPEVRIEHMHPVAGKAPSDEQYRRVNHRDQFTKDRRAYEGWRAHRLPEHVAAVRALRADRPEEPPVRMPRTSAPDRTRGKVKTMRPPRFFKNVRAATPEDIMITLADFAAQVPGDEEIVELGVFQGRTSLQMAWGARQGRRAHVTGIDPWSLEGNVYDPPFTEDSSRRWAFHWVQSLGYSRDITLINDFSHKVAENWGARTDNGEHPKKVGLLYVDGDHTKEGAKRDILSWAPHLASDARIAVDDYGHPDWPGVGEAVDELVAEGVLEPIELYHDRLAVTRLARHGDDEPKMRPTGAVTAMTSEGITPSPYPAMNSQVAVKDPHPVVARHAEAAPVRPMTDVELPNREELEAEWRRVDPEGVAVLEASAAALDNDTSSRERVSLDEALFVDGTSPGQPIGDLKLDQLRALAKKREIVLGARKDKKAEIVQALKDGR